MPIPRSTDVARAQAFREAAHLLEPCLDETTVVALPEIGAFGYSANARILDTAGLVSPEALRHYPLPFGHRANNAAPPSLLQAARPDYLVSADLFLPTQLLEAPWFQREYHQIASLPVTPPALEGKARSVAIHGRLPCP